MTRTVRLKVSTEREKLLTRKYLKLDPNHNYLSLLESFPDGLDHTYNRVQFEESQKISSHSYPYGKEYPGM